MSYARFYVCECVNLAPTSNPILKLFTSFAPKICTKTIKCLLPFINWLWKSYDNYDIGVLLD